MSMFTGDHVETNCRMSASFAVHTVETTCQQCKYRALGNKQTVSLCGYETCDHVDAVSRMVLNSTNKILDPVRVSPA